MKYPVLLLIVLSIILGLLWSLEIEYHGWRGLIWLSYFHLSIPIGFALFLVWANTFLNLDWIKRVLINVLGIIYGILIYYSLMISLTYLFVGGARGFILVMETPEWQLNIMRYSIFFILPFIPIGAYLVLKIFRSNPTIKYLVFAILGIVVSIPISLLLLEIVDHKGGHDLINTIKSGMLIPFWVFSIGILFISRKII